jgi:hypothetical protein
MKKIVLALFILLTSKISAQECENCGEHTAIAFQKIEWLEIQKPEDSALLEEWEKLEILWSEISYQLDQFFKNDKCLSIRQTVRTTKTPNVASNYRYTIYGIILDYSSGYTLRLWMQPACSDKKIAEAEIQFQMYPFLDVDKITQQAAAQLGPQIKKIHDYELAERDSKNYGLGGDLSEGYIEITMDNKMVKGEETRVVMKVVDCDGQVLKNKEISTAGTVGGVFTPAKFKTDADGSAIVKFRMTTDKTAFIKAACETKNVWGCDDLYTGTEAVKGIAGAPFKVSINYEQNETHWVNRATLPGVKIAGGATTETYDIQHRSVFYYFPSKKNLDEGLLIDASKDDGYYIGLTDVVPDAAAKTIYVIESGWNVFTKKTEDARIAGMVDNLKLIEAVEQGEKIEYEGFADILHPSEVMFHLGNANEPPSFMWGVQYPASDANIAGAGAAIIKGEEGVKWVVNKITDPKSIYKTEYLLSLTLNAAEEFRKGNKAMKDLFGMDLDDMSNTIDPTKNHQNMAGASGFQTITVRILSPYGSK